MTEATAFPLYRLFNQGDIPALADGWRSVIALPPGRRWITVIDWTTLETARLELADWHRLKPQPHTGLRLRYVRAAIRRRLNYVARTEAIRQALRLLEEATA